MNPEEAQERMREIFEGPCMQRLQDEMLRQPSLCLCTSRRQEALEKFLQHCKDEKLIGKLTDEDAKGTLSIMLNAFGESWMEHAQEHADAFRAGIRWRIHKNRRALSETGN
jgi:hypothetical protein